MPLCYYYYLLLYIVHTYCCWMVLLLLGVVTQCLAFIFPEEFLKKEGNAIYQSGSLSTFVMKICFFSCLLIHSALKMRKNAKYSTNICKLVIAKWLHKIDLNEILTPLRFSTFLAIFRALHT